MNLWVVNATFHLQGQPVSSYGLESRLLRDLQEPKLPQSPSLTRLYQSQFYLFFQTKGLRYLSLGEGMKIIYLHHKKLSNNVN